MLWSRLCSTRSIDHSIATKTENYKLSYTTIVNFINRANLQKNSLYMAIECATSHRTITCTYSLNVSYRTVALPAHIHWLCPIALWHYLHIFTNCAALHCDITSTYSLNVPYRTVAFRLMLLLTYSISLSICWKLTKAFWARRAEVPTQYLSSMEIGELFMKTSAR